MTNQISTDKEEDRKILTVENISHPYIKQNSTIFIELTKFNTLDIHFILASELKPDFEVLNKINTLNRTQNDFRVYINQDNKLTLTHSMYDVTEENALYTIPWSIDRLVSPKVLEVIAPLSGQAS